MSAVAEVVNILAAGRIVAPRGTTLKLDVVDVDTGIDNVGESTLASAVVVDVRRGPRRPVRDRGQAVGNAGLRGEVKESPLLIFLNIGNLVN